MEVGGYSDWTNAAINSKSFESFKVYIIRCYNDNEEFIKIGRTFSKLKKRFCSGRKAFGIHGANALSRICVLSEKFNIDELETPTPIDTSAEDWIKEIMKLKEFSEMRCSF